MANGIIEQIKDKIDIVNEIGNVVALKKSGKAYKGLCPFHNERSPSFYVFPDTKTWRCFGCNEGGDVFSFVAKQQTLDFPETLKVLAEKAGIDTSRRIFPTWTSSGKQGPSAIQSKLSIASGQRHRQRTR